MIDRIAFWQHVLGLPPEEQVRAAAEMGVTRDALVKAARQVLGLPEEHPLAAADANIEAVTAPVVRAIINDSARKADAAIMGVDDDEE